jgi:uncharacterized protein (UPF0333 family)
LARELATSLLFALLAVPSQIASIEFATKNFGTRLAVVTTVANSRSRKVMSKLGIENRNENYFYPSISENSGVKEHIYCEISHEKSYREFQENSITVTAQQSPEHYSDSSV